MSNKRKFSRRKFLKRTGIVLGTGAVLLYFGRHRLRSMIAEFVANMDLPSGISEFSPLVWFEISEDNKFILKSPKIEMGQGTLTGLAMLAAEELGVPLDQIKIIHSGSAIADDAGTGGSTSTGSLFIPLRETAATLREMLLTAAADHLNLPKENLKIVDGHISQNDQKISLFELSQAVLEWAIPEEVQLKDKKDFQLVGKDVPRVDLALKVMGEPIYGIDQQMDNVLQASILRTPYIQGELTSADTSKTEQSPGVKKVVRKGNWIAVIADKRYQADIAKRLIKAEWSTPKKWQQQEIEDLLQVGLGKYVNIQKEGNAVALIEAEEATVFKATYTTPFGVHAQMEPNGALASYKDGKVHIKMSTQAATRVQAFVADQMGLSKDDVTIEVTYSGGGFGRRYFLNVAADAAFLSKEMGRPVHVLRDREEEFRNGYYRPLSKHLFEAVLDRNKKEIIGIRHQQMSGDMLLANSFPPIAKKILAADFLSSGHGAHIEYSIPNKMAKFWMVDLPLHTGIWRGVGCFTNGFARETFMDEVARELDIDPIELRLKYLDKSDDLQRRMKRVLETVRDLSDWQKPAPKNTGRGVAIFVDRKTVCAAVMEVQKVDNTIRITKVTHVSEPGIIVNPEGARTQVEGAIMMGISAAMYEKAFVKDGQLVQTNYHNYLLAKLVDCPEINVILLEDEQAKRPYGMGEPPIAPIAPAISNAIFDLTGERKRELPFVES